MHRLGHGSGDRFCIVEGGRERIGRLTAGKNARRYYPLTSRSKFRDAIPARQGLKGVESYNPKPMLGRGVLS